MPQPRDRPAEIISSALRTITAVPPPLRKKKKKKKKKTGLPESPSASSARLERTRCRCLHRALRRDRRNCGDRRGGVKLALVAEVVLGYRGSYGTDGMFRLMKMPAQTLTTPSG